MAIPRFWTDHYEEIVQVPESPTTNPVVFSTPTVTNRPALHVLYFDLEIRRSLEEMGDSWDNVKQGGGVSALVIWDEVAGRPYFYDDHTLLEAAQHLERADVVVGFNSAWFDLPLIVQHLDKHVSVKEHLDIFSLVKSALARENKSWKGHGLDALCMGTIGRGKSGHGAQAPGLAKHGRFAELFNYCLDDVLLTRELAKFAAKNGFVIDRDGDKLALDIPDWFVLGA